jgi:hypothetical protein
MADEFDFDKGVKDDYVGVIVDAYFKASDQAPDDVSLVLKKAAEDGDVVEDFYRVGTDWASFDGGETVEHPVKSRLRADSQAATLVDRAMTCGAETVLRERSSANGSLGPRTAKLWPGLRFHWKVEQRDYNFTSQKTGEKVERSSFKSYPDRFLGVEEIMDGENGTGSTAGPGTGASGAASSGSTSTSESAPPEVIAKLKVLAQSKSFADWVDEALTIDYVRDKMLSVLSDESYYNSLK